MPPKIEKQPPIVVEIDSSDDEENGGTNIASSKPTLSQKSPHPHQSSATNFPSPPSYQTLESRSFWKAGAYAVTSTAKPAFAQDSLEHARVHPKFLHSNATSHKWAFGAIAELLDNAVDEIHNGATFVKVDKIDIVKDNSPALLFEDDGGGMDPEGIRKCMSLGYSSKKSNTTIGQYGNGFKTSTMRLGADVIVFSRATHAGKKTQSAGLLSYTFLRKTGQDDVIVPMIDFDISGHWAEPIIYSSQGDWSINLKTILDWSPFTSKEELMQQFEDIGPHGTRIIIYNLWLNDEGIYELSFDDDNEDIRLRDEASHGGLTKLNKKTIEIQSHISYRLRYSLRAYVSILYLKEFTNFRIILRGKPVQQYNIADELRYAEVVLYRPQIAMSSREVTVATTIGFVKEAPALPVSGFSVYHKNRLIRPFWKVTSDGSSKGNGVLGVLEPNFIEPAHDKQDFEKSSLFVKLEARLKQMVHDYWKSKCHLVGFQTPGSSLRNRQQEHPVQSPVGHATNMQMPYDHHVTVLSAGVQGENCVDQSMVGLGAKGQDFDGQSGSGHQTSIQDISVEPLITGLSANEVTSEDGPGTMSVDQICDENIQLFMRCEEHMKKESKLKHMVEELERELEEAKRKRAELNSLVEIKRKQKLLDQQTEKVS